MTSLAPDLRRQGGKGANLLRLDQAGLPVPRFRVLDTDEYRAFVNHAGLDDVIAEALAVVRGPGEPATPAPGRRGRATGDTTTAARESPHRAAPAPWVTESASKAGAADTGAADAGAAEVASERIRDAFRAAGMSDDQRARLLDAVSVFDEVPVAVRSSATAEDLPGHSFAGQQDSFLDVRGTDAILDAVVACWSSIWTARAITYRERNGIDHDDVALAVVIQDLVPADASGVMFTANPRTGRRDETVVDATFGLGEALVSGQVTPDTFTVRTRTGEVRERSLAGSAPTLTEAHLLRLVALGLRIQQHFHEPMDVEWARVGEDFSILQARPITTLYPVPDPPRKALPPDAAQVEAWFSFGAFQGMLEPITPLGQDMIRMLMSGAGRAIHRDIDWRTNRFVLPAGERLWMRFDGVARIRVTRSVMGRFLPMVDPAMAGLIGELITEPEFAVTHATPPARVMAPLSRLLAGIAARVRRTYVDPAAARRAIERESARALDRTRAIADATTAATNPQARLNARVGVMEDMALRFFPGMLPLFPPVLIPTMSSLSKLREAAARTGLPDADALAMSALRALPGNVTTEMDLALGDVAATIRADATSWGWVSETPARDLADAYLAGNLPLVAQQAIGDFMALYGMRGVAEIDLGAPRWRDDPEPVMRTIKSLVEVTDTAQQPRVLHSAGQHEAGRSLRTLMDASTRADAQRIRTWARTIRGAFGARETPKFTIIRMFGLIRDQLDASGRDLVEAGRLESADDIYYLHLDELRHAFAADWRPVVAERRARHGLEARRTAIPAVLVSDGRALHPGLSADGDLRGTGVSPGVAEGPVRVIRDPRTQQLEPGEILVCQGTDPAWTPLFLTAAGLVTEVGGLMTHGSVVAREYGIPGVVGVPQATTMLEDGTLIRIDGTSGAIELL